MSKLPQNSISNFEIAKRDMLQKELPFVISEETRKERKRIVSVYNTIYFSKGMMPEKIGDLREMLKEKYEQKFGMKISSKKLDEFAYVWHPKYNFRKDKDVENQKYFQSYGCLTGNYYPSETSFEEGTLVTSRGVLPAVLAETFTSKMKSFERVANSERTVYACWLRGQPEPPFYNCHLIKPLRHPPRWNLKESGFFKVRGIVEQIDGEKMLVRVQRNYVENTEETIFTLAILDYPCEAKIGEFWSFEAMFEEGFLHCKYAKQV